MKICFTRSHRNLFSKIALPVNANSNKFKQNKIKVVCISTITPPIISESPLIADTDKGVLKFFICSLCSFYMSTVFENRPKEPRYKSDQIFHPNGHPLWQIIYHNLITMKWTYFKAWCVFKYLYATELKYLHESEF